MKYTVLLIFNTDMAFGFLYWETILRLYDDMY